MNKNLRDRLKQLAKLRLTDNGTGIFRVSAEGMKIIQEIAEEAADTLEDLENKLNLYRQRKIRWLRRWRGKYEHHRNRAEDFIQGPPEALKKEEEKNVHHEM